MSLTMRCLLVVVLASVLAGAGCGVSASSSGAGLTDYDSELAYRLVNEEQGLLLDVRTAREYAAGHVPGAKNIDIRELPSRVKEVEALVGGNKERPIVIYCSRGVRAAEGKRILLKAGFSRVMNLGGPYNWPAK